MSSWSALLALLVTSEPAPVTSTVLADTSVVSLPERLLAQRTRLRLSEGQVAHLRGLADRYRHQEKQDRLASKPWLRRAPSHALARAEVLHGLSAEQRRTAEGLIAPNQ